ncbi:RusA family crossover junction endodeoxyribonuclease [Devosia beringensis]|uniref:RusA family crossover junction endodeoxyribonuclease n=1 Tax=Devosia beringensis TaxID=2657486 RepID=UPI00186BB063|nr:RusA family crossover junction endodeoxyribonuclease [Devosia beringensis]
MAEEDELFPFEMLVQATPISLQASANSKQQWMEHLKQIALARREETYELGFLDHRALAVTILYFTAAPMEGDIDNIIKPILDSLIPVVYLDDKVIERIVAQKLEPDVDWQLTSPTDQLAAALDLTPPVVYIRVDDDFGWRTLQ